MQHPPLCTVTESAASFSHRRRRHTRFPCISTRNSADSLHLLDDPLQQTPHDASSLRKRRTPPVELSNLRLRDAFCDFLPGSGRNDGEKVSRGGCVGSDVLGVGWAVGREQGSVGEVRMN